MQLEILSIFGIPWVAACMAVFVWWFLTGLLLFIVKKIDQINESAHLHTLIILTPVLLCGCFLYWHSMSSITLASVYISFLGSLLIWAWFELAFLTGFLTGPVKTNCPPNISNRERFFHAWRNMAYSEVGLLAVLLTLTLISANAENRVGLWTFWILFFARICAKLNLFLGVPNVNTEFLPSPVKHLASYFKVGGTSWFFPISISIISFTLFFWVDRIFSIQSDDILVVGYTLLASLTALALIEHWFMVVPIRDAELWKWMLPTSVSKKEKLKKNKKQVSSEKIHGL